RAQLAERDQQIAVLENELRLSDQPRVEPEVLAVSKEWIELYFAMGGTVLFLSGMWFGGRRAASDGHYQDPEWNPAFDPDTGLKEPHSISVSTTTSTTQTTTSTEEHESAEQDDPLGPDDINLELQTRPFAQPDDIDFSETNPIDELESYIAKGQYAQAKILLGRLINLFPDETSFRIYLLKILHAGRDCQAFHEHALYLHERRDRIDDDLWQEVVEMGLKLMPDEGLYGGANVEESEPGPAFPCDEPSQIIEFSSAKSALQASPSLDTPVHDMVAEEEKDDVIAFLGDLKNNENAP
ncbi:MAG: hypothetical protein OES09_16830, partial [Gammaproteobacteria bacterium]|nr:hypothetical protein [Gammaproteobacteria bacterium]